MLLILLVCLSSYLYATLVQFVEIVLHIY